MHQHQRRIKRNKRDPDSFYKRIAFGRKSRIISVNEMIRFETHTETHTEMTKHGNKDVGHGDSSQFVRTFWPLI